MSQRGVAQLAEQRSPKPQAAGSSPVSPATVNYGAVMFHGAFFMGNAGLGLRE